MCVHLYTDTCAGGGCGVMVEALINYHWYMHPTSIFYLYKVFEYLHLHMLWMGIVWVHYYTGMHVMWALA